MDPIQRRWRALFVPVTLVLATSAAWGLGCTSEAEPGVAPDVPDGGALDDSGRPAPVDAGDSPDVAAPTGCDGDLEADGLHRHLACAGLYASLPDKTLAPGVTPYEPAIGFWSDGAAKQRWIALPAGSKIDISNWDEWTFPVGTKLWKEFTIAGKRIETRLFAKGADGTWAHATYRWNDDESDAVRKDGGESLPGLGIDGGTYEIPTASECEQCHVGRKDHVLGFDAVSLGLPGATGMTLAKLAADGLLSQTPPATTLTLPGSPAAAAAIGWVNANCGACHNENLQAAASFRRHFHVRASDLARPDGGAPATLEELDVWKQGYCVDTSRTEPDAGGPYKYIRGGSPERSLMSVLAGRRAPEGSVPNSSVQMPPIVTRAVDHEGLALLDTWIASLPPCP